MTGKSPDPAERAVGNMSRKQLEQAAESGNKLAQKILRQMLRAENRRGRRRSR